MKPTGESIATAAVQAVGVGYTYDEMDCQAFIEHCARQAGGSMDYSGSNDMSRRAAWLGTLAQARAQGRLVPGAGVLIREETEANLPARYAGDGLGDFSHVGLYVGENALTDVDKNGNARSCDVCTPAPRWAAWPGARWPTAGLMYCGSRRSTTAMRPGWGWIRGRTAAM